MNRPVSAQSGNILLYILIAIVLIGLITVALRSNGGMTENVDKESDASKATQLIRYAGELSQAVQIILSNGASEADVRFAIPGSVTAGYGDIATTPANQVFSSQGGKAVYRLPPAGVNDGTAWAFSAGRSMPQVGSDKADLTAILTNVTDSSCQAIDSQLGFSSVPTAACGTVTSGFLGASDYSSSPIILSTAGFSLLPAPQACIKCTSPSRNLYIVTLIAR